MNCPACGGKTTVVDCAADCKCVYRKRKCVACGHTFATTEQESNDIYKLKNLRSKRNAKDRKN
jgi:transcriptional regulator NrdR family protein